MAGSGREPSLSRSSSAMASPRFPRSRTQSISSDRPSTIGHSLLSPPQSVSPEAGFIATSAASQIVTNDHDSHADSWYDESGMIPTGETALVSQGALQLVNSFLDQLLFNFLQVAKATTLSALRPAVTDVLKPKLAKDAINNADEELREYLGGADEDDYVQPRGADPGRDWDLELVWKRTRLRCMVYSSLGDMEEEDEDLHMEQENLEIGADEQISDVISPAVAIFLTSVLEYMGELTLTVAGQAAYHRMRVSYEKQLKEGTRTVADFADRIVVEDGDMERVALDRTLGRLWRGWKKRIRTPAIMEVGGRPFSRASGNHYRNGSNATTDGLQLALGPSSEAGNNARQTLGDQVAEPMAGSIQNGLGGNPDAGSAAEEPAAIPLPMSERDIDEIEVPGLATYSDDGMDEDDYEEAVAPRPKSFFGLQMLVESEASKPSFRRARSSSLPMVPSNRFHAYASRNGDAYETVISSDEEDEGDREIYEEALSEQPKEAKKKGPRPVAIHAGLNPSDAAAIGVAKTTDEDRRDLEVEPEDHIDAYERAEVMTSSRVSVASSSPPGSESGIKKSNSVRSARIVDVPAHKGCGSRSPSIDATENAHRQSTSTRVNQSSSPSNVDDFRRSKAPDTVARSSAMSPPLRSSLDRVRPSLQNETVISESEEEGEGARYSRKRRTDGQASHATIGRTTSPSEPDSPDSPRARGRQTLMVQPPRKSSLTRSHPDHHASTKVTILNTSKSGNSYIDESIPEVPPKSPGRGTFGRPDTANDQPMERIRTVDSDDTPFNPIGSTPRQTHTSGSSSSSATGRLKPLRTSEEHVPSHAESVARNFEELIQSNQTITYTLTPENMRDMDSPRSPSSPALPRFSRSNDGKPGDRSRSSSVVTDSKGASSSRMVPVNSHSPSDSKSAKPAPIVVPASGKPAGRKSSLSSGPRSPRMPAAMARDARVPTDHSTADFAEFIKSTGPPGDNRPPPVRTTHPPSPEKPSIDSRRVSSTSNRNRYQPRDAAVESSADNSDLIDFIRQGPPGPTPAHRIPRHVAPFRNTGDSENMSAATAGRAVDASIPEVRNSQASTNVTEAPSIQSSANSNTALLKNKAQPAQHNRMFDEDDMMPKRKQRRVRDPYAIDFSDEDDDDDLLVTPRPPVKKEESLAEFLRNFEPPPEPQEAPISQKVPKKKASAPSLIGRFSRSGLGRELKQLRESNGFNSNSKNPPESRSLHSRTGTSASATTPKGAHVPIQVSVPTGYDKYGSRDTGSSQPRGPPLSGSAGRVPMKKFEPREATPAVRSTGTADLAAFLRDSEPPPSAAAPPLPLSPTEESNGFSKMFSRRKKAYA